uniref:NB-ARC domain-containing protein n=1 Tax=Oryza punctata TaxID=4537 RepID=A0A0E0MML8_ORYPU
MDIFRAVESVSGKICSLITTDWELRREMDRKIKHFSSEMNMMNVCISSSSGSIAGAIGEAWLMELQELAYDMEDALDLMVLGTKTKVPLPKRALRTVGLMDPRPQHILDIRGFDERLQSLLDQWDKFKQGRGDATPPTTTPSPTVGGTVSFGCGLRPVGIQHHTENLLDLLRHVDGQPKQLRVISIVGFRGVGKTTLAKVVYDHDHSSLGEPFDCKAWVQVAWSTPLAAGSNDDAAKLLKETLRELDPGKASANINDNTDIMALCENIRKFLQGKSRIIVTTSVQSVAKKCSLGGFMYRLEGLNEDDSDKLLWQLVECERDQLPQDVQSHSVDIVRKCDGLPLALIGVAEYVRLKLADLKRGELRCSAIVRELGNYLAGRPQHAAFQEAHATLKECYEDLYNHDLKTCLLSVSMFPKNYSIRRKSLVRRWMAEQLVPYDAKKHGSTVADENFEKLVDRIMIQRADDEEDPAPAVVPGAVKNKCRVHGVLLDFLLDKSASSKFASLIQNGEHMQTTNRDNNPSPRRLAIVYDPNRAGGGNSNKAKLAEMVEGLDLSHVRSLTVAGTELSDFKLKCCKVLRVLDLDGCTGITGGVLRSICKLKVLRYLCLRGTAIDACGLPPEMAELRFLETLDVRDIVVRGSKSKAEDHAGTITLPWNVLCLPCLKYLFGAFELPRDIPGPARRGLALWPKAARASGGASAQAKLHTLAGIFIGESDREEHQCLQNFLGLMHQDRLKKIKIWWNKKGVKGSKAKPTTAPTHLLVEFLKKRCFTLDSLSLDFGDQSLDFLDFPPVDVHLPCRIESVKLRGKLSRLPGFITAANTKTISDHALSKLYLSYTGLSCEALLLLQCLPNLRYLKLIEDNSNFTDGTLTLNVVRGFPSLRGLHVQAPKLPKVIIVAGGEDKTVAMQHLTTLQLLCNDISGFQAAHIDYFHRLEQVVLLKSSLDIDKDAAKAWEAARMKHMNRPRIDTVEVKISDHQA